jgi:hypothetical protein
MWFMGHSFAVRCARWCLLLSVLVGAAGARAGEVEGLYEAQVPVTSQREAERQSAVRAAFQQVLVKVTGDRSAATQQRLQSLVQSPLKYVQQYRYRPLPPGFAPPAAAAEADAGRPAQLLWVRFDAQAVDQLLQQVNEPVWGRARPATLVWLAVEEPGGRYLVGGDARRDLLGELDAQAQARGIPLLFPLLDLEDQRRVGFADVWGGFERELRAASVRYDPGAVLVGRVHRESGGWSGRWSLYQDTGVEHWQSGARERGEVLVAGVDGAADRLASRFARALSADAALPVDLLVMDIERVEEYGRAMKYLRSLESVGGLAVTRVDAAGVHFRLLLRGDRAGLVQTIGFGRVLTPASAGTAAEGELAYRILP